MNKSVEQETKSSFNERSVGTDTLPTPEVKLSIKEYLGTGTKTTMIGNDGVILNGENDIEYYNEPSNSIFDVENSMKKISKKVDGATQTNGTDMDETISNKDDEEGMAADKKLLDNNNDKNDDDDDEYETEDLDETTYTLIFTSPYCSPAFAFAIIIFIFQQAILWILLFDLFPFQKIFDDPENLFRIPAGVPTQVTAAQGLAMVLAVAIQDDLIVGIINLCGGPPNVNQRTQQQDDYNDDDDDGQLSSTEGQTRRSSWMGKTPPRNKFSNAKWNLSCILQLTSGFLLMFVIFILTMQEDSVKNVCLNFAALMFIAEIDEIAFKLASFGFVTNHIQDHCESVKTIHLTKSINAKRKENIFYRILILFYALVLFTAYAYLVQLQTSGKFVCNTIFLQSGDAINPNAALYSGLYYLQDSRVGDRSRYVDEHGLIQIAYCRSEKIWTISRISNDFDTDICQQYLAKTEVTNSFDVSSLDTDAWTVLNYYDHRHYGVASQFIPTDLLTITCNECDDTCRSGFGTCVSKSVSMKRNLTSGEIISNGVKADVCQCTDGRYGVNCEFPPPCKELVPDNRFEPFSHIVSGSSENANSIDYVTVNSSFHLSNITVNHRPIYYSDDGYMLLFLGRRWGFARIRQFFDLYVHNECFIDNDHPAESLLDCSKQYFETFFQAGISKYNIFYISDPMDYLTASDNDSPYNIRWYRTPRLNPNFKEDTPGPTLLCAECTTFTNPCENFGVCGKTTPGVCDCPIGTTGALCELQETCADRNGFCYNDGTCNEWTGECDCPNEYYGSLCQFTRSNDVPLK